MASDIEPKDERRPDLTIGPRRSHALTISHTGTLSLWKDGPLRAIPANPSLDRRRTVCVRCNGPIDGRPLPRQLAALSLLHIALCRICYLDIEESASSFGETGRAFDDRLFGKLAALAEELASSAGPGQAPN
jgi:hypothetical protein